MILSYLRGNPYGEFIQALAMLLILSFQRFQAIRKRHPVSRYVWAAIGLKRLDERLDRSEHRLYVLISMGLVGSFIGGSIPLIPTSLGSLAGAVTLSLATLQPNAAGDVCYCMGLRLVALAGQVGRLNSDLGIVTKGGAAASKLINTILVFDRKHRVQEKLGSLANWVRDRLSSSDDPLEEPPPPMRRNGPPQPRRGGPPPRRPPGPRDGASRPDASSRPPVPPKTPPAKQGGFFSKFGRRTPKPPAKRPPPPPPPAAENPIEAPIYYDDAADFDGWDFGAPTIEHTTSQ